MTGDAEALRLDEADRLGVPWRRWGPYLSERQWGTVREDYSPNGDAWSSFPHDHARSRAYRWGEDGIAGISDDKQRLCFSLAMWNGRDPILKERMFGLTNSEGNHGEDVKEYYFYLDSTPTHSYLSFLGPVWFPVNALLIRALLNLYVFYGDEFTVECPTGSGQQMTLYQVAAEISNRLTRIYLPDADGRRPVYGGQENFQTDPHWRNLLLFHEYFHGDNGAGIGASHQTGWTGLVALTTTLVHSMAAGGLLSDGLEAAFGRPGAAARS